MNKQCNELTPCKGRKPFCLVFCFAISLLIHGVLLFPGVNSVKTAGKPLSADRAGSSGDFQRAAIAVSWHAHSLSSIDMVDSRGQQKADLNLRGDADAIFRRSPSSEVLQSDLPMADESASDTDLSIISYYFARNEVQRQARLLTEIDQENSRFRSYSSDIDEGGTAILELFINESGRVDQVKLGNSSMSGRLLNVVRESFLQAEFSPAEREGLSVKSRMKIEVSVFPNQKR